MPRFSMIAAGLALAAAPGVAGCSCSRSSEPTPEPVSSAALPVASSAGSKKPPDHVDVRPHAGPLQKDDAGHYIPTTPPPPVDSALVPPQPKRTPDMDLDANDPARDYVKRYVVGSLRYGDKTTCTLYGKSYDKGGQRAVDVGDDPACSAGASTAVRDTFLVDVGADRLSVDDAANRPPLQLWPDGSAPGAPPKPVRELSDMKGWNSQLHAVLKDLQLVPIRVQLFGRGTYPLVTIAGWRPQFGKESPPSALDDAAKKLCAATADEPLSFIAGIDASTTLRLRCPGGKWRWENF